MRTSTLLILWLLSAVTACAQQKQTSPSTSGPVSYKGADHNGVFTFIEKNPEFPGGDKALVEFLQLNTHYPAMERDNKIEGKVIVRFVVMEDGSIGDVEVTKPVSKGLDAEAVRVVKSLPKFIPGKQEGKPVKVYFNLPVIFKLDGQIK